MSGDVGGVAGRLSGTVSPFRAEQGTSLETPSRARAKRRGSPRFLPPLEVRPSSVAPDPAPRDPRACSWAPLFGPQAGPGAEHPWDPPPSGEDAVQGPQARRLRHSGTQPTRPPGLCPGPHAARLPALLGEGHRWVPAAWHLPSEPTCLPDALEKRKENSER